MKVTGSIKLVMCDQITQNIAQGSGIFYNEAR